MVSKSTNFVIENTLKTNGITIITGLPGTGKSLFMQKIILKMKEIQPPVKILYINPNEPRWRHITNCDELTSSLKGFGVGKSALFIDNIDRITDFDKSLNGLENENSLQIFISGKIPGKIIKKTASCSNKDISEIQVFPQNYHSFLKCNQIKHSTMSFHSFLSIGGLPRIINYNGTDIQDYLEKTADSIVLNEIIEPNNIRDARQFRTFLTAMTHFSGQEVSTRKICSWFEHRHMTISPQTALDFLTISEDTGILQSIPIFSLTDKKNIQGSKVWYFGDVGIREIYKNYLTGKMDSDIDNELNRAIENAVFLMLSEMGWRLSRGRIETSKANIHSKLSFICEKKGIRKYIQYCATNLNETGKQLYKNTLLHIPDGWEKIFLDTDSLPIDSNGILTTSFYDLPNYIS